MRPGLVERDPGDVTRGVERWLRHRHPEWGDLAVAEVRRPAAGLTNETLIADVSTDGVPSGQVQLVLRLPPAVATFPDVDLAGQAELHRWLHARGIPAPSPCRYEPDAEWLGTPFLALPFVAGHIPGQVPLLDPWITEASAAEQRRVQHGLVDLLARLHRLDASGSPLAGNAEGPYLPSAVESWKDYADWASDGQPAGRLVDLLAWCEEHCPTDEPPPSVLWGDPRLENLVFDDGRAVVGALDWETASVGPAELDLAWYLALDRVQVHFLGGQRVTGFAPPGEVVARHEQALGRPVRDLEWHQIFAVTRSIAIAGRQARIAIAAGQPYPVPADERNPMFDLVERWADAGLAGDP